MTAAGTTFDPGLRGAPCWLELAGGERVGLSVDRWSAELDEFDRLMLARCTGPTLDIGCGPGRLAAELVSRGVPALGVDTSGLAVRLTTSRGAVALRRNVFSRLPGEGRWSHVLLADGNIGIGGDPHRLLRRAQNLLHRGGSALVELSPRGVGLHPARVRLDDGNGPTDWFDWAWLGIDAIERTAANAAMRVHRVFEAGGRCLAELTSGRSG
jgi:SAM-dependent methyltransferase